MQDGIYDAWLARTGKKEVAEEDATRTAKAVENRLANIYTNVHKFMSIKRRIENRRPTGNVTEEDLIIMTVAEWCAEVTYEAVNGDREDDARTGKTKKRKAKTVRCPWVHCYRELKNWDNFSGAAAAEAAEVLRCMRLGGPDGVEGGATGTGAPNKDDEVDANEPP